MGIVAHTSNPSTREAKEVDFCELEASMAYLVLEQLELYNKENLSYKDQASPPSHQPVCPQIAKAWSDFLT